MAREIIVLDMVKSPDGTKLSARCVLWLIAPTNRITVRPGFVSGAPLLAAISWGVTAAELAALQAGTTVEDGYQTTFQTTTVLLQAEAQQYYGIRQAILTASANATKFNGAFWDGTTWTLPP